MAQEFRISTSQNVDLGYVPASLGDRILAYLIDSLIAFSYVVVVFFVLLGIDSMLSALGENFFVSLIAFLPVVFYHLLFEVFNNGQSPGKRSMRLRVVSLDGTNVTFGSYFLRWLLRIVDINLTSGLGAIISIAVSKTGQRIGDLVAGTTVIKEQTEYSLDQLAYAEPDPDYVPSYTEVHLLTSRHIEIIRETLNNHEIADITPHLTVLADKIAGVMGVDRDRPPRDFLVRIVKDYSQLRH